MFNFLNFLKFIIVILAAYFFSSNFIESFYLFPLYKNIFWNLVMVLCSILFVYFLISRQKRRFMVFLLIIISPFFGYVIPPARYWIRIFYALIPLIVIFLSPKDIFKNYYFKKPFMILSMALFLSTIFGVNALNSLAYLYLNIGFYLFFCLIVKSINSMDDLRKLIKVYLAPAALISLLGFAQWVLKYNISFYGQESLSNIDAAAGREYLRTVGVFFEPLSFAQFLNMGILLFLYKTIRADRLVKKLFFFFFFILSCFVLITTVSRTSFFAATFSIAGFFILYPKDNIRKTAVILVIIFLFILGVIVKDIINKPGLNPLGNRLINIEQDLSTSRVNYWIKSFPIAKDYPLGIGAENYKQVILNYDRNALFKDTLDRPRSIMAHPESGFLLILYEYGWLGLAGILLLFFKGLYGMIKIYSRSSDRDTRSLAFILFLCIFSIAFNFITTYNYRDFGVAAGCWIIFAFAEAIVNLTRFPPVMDG